ncbi:MAG: DALR domain-containing protein [Planctomycetaceae bacterium]
MSTHYRSLIDFSLENITATAKSMDGFYRLFETCERITGRSFYGLVPPSRRADSAATGLADVAAVAPEFAAELKLLSERFLEAMDDDFNTGGAIGVLFEMRRSINSYINAAKLEESAKPEQQGALLAAMTRLKELSNVLGVFRQPQQKSPGQDDELVNGLMQLILDIRADARKTKNWGVADKIRDALKSLNVVVEDGKEGVRWSRG